MEIDYKQLLIKYIAHVLDVEGISFVGSSRILSEDEQKELEELQQEAEKLL